MKSFEWLWKPGLASVLGIVGPAVVLIGAIFTAITYTGSAGEVYSPANHLVSELGDTNISESALVFNVSLMIGGLCTLAFMPGLARAGGGGGLVTVAGALGFVAGIGGFFVGVLPINLGFSHVIAAFVFFVLGWVAITLFTVDFGLRPDSIFPNKLVIPGLISFMLSLFFLLLVITGLPDALFIPNPRPDVWGAAFTEWLALLAMLAWTAIVAVTWRVGIGRRSLAQVPG